MNAYNVGSEVGNLREVVVHRPGSELGRLTPSNVDELLFDDIMWAERAREEHDAFVEQMTRRGVVVHRFGSLLAEALDEPGAREFLQEQLTTATRFERGLVMLPRKNSANRLRRAATAGAASRWRDR